MNFDWNNPYPTTRTPVFARNVVATSQPLAAQAGLRILANGGNAVDAAIAAAATLTLVEPVSNGLGSDCFAIVWDGSKLHGLNASGPAPAAWNLDYFRRRHQGAIPTRGWDSVTVPGCVAGWAALHEKLGKLPLADVLAPAIDYAERGFAVSPMVQQEWAAQADVLQPQPGFAEHFLPRGRAPHTGEHFVLKAAAATLKRIAASRARDFYEGETAHKLVAHAQAHEAAMTLADLRDYAPEWVTPISQSYRGHTLHQIPPNGQGIAALIALGILQNFDLAARPVDHPNTQHLLIEAMKLAFADVYAHVADGRHMRLSPEQMLAPGYLAERARLIDPNVAQAFACGHAPQGGTVYLTAADRNGMMVSFIQSNYMGFGSGVVVPGTGVSLQNRGHCFSTQPDHPNVVAGGKRPSHTIIPAFAMNADGTPQMAFGVMGGPMQSQGHLQMALRVLRYGQNPQAAADAPRWRVTGGKGVAVEPAFDAEVVAALRARGHEVTIEEGHGVFAFGGAQLVLRDGDHYIGGSDPRKDGGVVAF